MFVSGASFITWSMLQETDKEAWLYKYNQTPFLFGMWLLK